MPPPRKKDRLRGSLSPMREQFPPTGTLCGGQADLPGKSRPGEGAKTAPARAGDCAQAAPIGGTAGDRACLVPGRHRTGCPRRGRGYARAQNSPQTGVGGLTPHGRVAGNGVSGAGKAPHWAPAGAEGIPGAKTAPGGGRGLCAGCAMGGTAGDGGVWCRESTALGARWDRGTPGRKNSPRRAPEAVWMRDMGVTCPGRSV